MPFQKDQQILIVIAKHRPEEVVEVKPGCFKLDLIKLEGDALELHQVESMKPMDDCWDLFVDSRELGSIAPILY